MACLTAFFTAAYSARLLYLSMAGTFAGSHFVLRKAFTEVNTSSTTQGYQLVNAGLLSILAVASLMVGFIFRELFLGPVNPF